MRNETASREIESLDYYLQNHTNDYSEESHMAMMMAIEALEQHPKTGHWIFYHPLQVDDEGAYMCSVCRCGDWGLDPEIDKFCFNCGARMVESEDEE